MKLPPTVTSPQTPLPTSKKPQFIVLGAPKCGTTALHTYLRDQVGVFVPELKEPHYFAGDVPIRRRLDEAQYLSLFDPAPIDALRGEVSVWYLYSRQAAEQMHQLCGDLRIVAMLRDPVEAMHALHGQFVLNGDEDLIDFEQALDAEEVRLQGHGRPAGSWVGAQCLCYREVYRYGQQIERYLRFFDRSRLHVMLYDEFARDTEKAYRGLLEFLQIPWHATRELQPVHRHRRLRWAWLKRLERHYEAPLRRLARRWLPQDDRRRRFGRRLLRGLRRLNSRQVQRAPLKPDFERRLRLEMTPEVRRLETLIGRTTGWAED